MEKERMSYMRGVTPFIPLVSRLKNDYKFSKCRSRPNRKYSWESIRNHQYLELNSLLGKRLAIFKRMCTLEDVNMEATPT